MPIGTLTKKTSRQVTSTSRPPSTAPDAKQQREPRTRPACRGLGRPVTWPTPVTARPGITATGWDLITRTWHVS